MKKYIFIIFVVGLLLTACSNDDTKTANDANTTEQEQSTDTESPKSNPSDDENPETGDDTNGDKDVSDDTTDDSESSNEPENSESGGRYSSDDAIRLVKDYLKAEGFHMEMNYLYDGKDDNGHYRIQVFEVTDHGNGETHTATFNWFFVDPETGEITILFDL